MTPYTTVLSVFNRSYNNSMSFSMHVFHADMWKVSIHTEAANKIPFKSNWRSFSFKKGKPPPKGSYCQQSLLNKIHETLQSKFHKKLVQISQAWVPNTHEIKFEPWALLFQNWYQFTTVLSVFNGSYNNSMSFSIHLFPADMWKVSIHTEAANKIPFRSN